MYLLTLLDRPSVSLSSCHVVVNLYAQTCQIRLILQDKSFTCGKIIPSLTRLYSLIILHVFFFFVRKSLRIIAVNNVFHTVNFKNCSGTYGLACVLCNKVLYFYKVNEV